MVSFIFWQRWLFYSSLLFVLFGIGFAFDGNNPLFAWYDHSLSKIFWGSNSIPESTNNFSSFIHGPLGGTIACCYILLAYIAWYPFKRKEIWARNAIVVAYGTWILLDSAICLYYDVYFQIYLINAFSFLQKALPIIFTWNDFKKVGRV